MWPKCSHVLAPLTEKAGKFTFEWLPIHDVAFKKMKVLVAMDSLLANPDHNEPFLIKNKACDYQLGSIIK